MKQFDVQMTADFHWAADPVGDTKHQLLAGRLCILDADIAAAVVSAGAGHFPKTAPLTVAALVEAHARQFGGLAVPRVPGTNAIDGTLIVQEVRSLSAK